MILYAVVTVYVRKNHIRLSKLPSLWIRVNVLKAIIFIENLAKVYEATLLVILYRTQRSCTKTRKFLPRVPLLKIFNVVWEHFEFFTCPQSNASCDKGN
jgi:hypothetical protein